MQNSSRKASRKEASLPSSKAHLYSYTPGYYVYNIQQVTGKQDQHQKLNCELFLLPKCFFIMS